jgi:hypothetical protein
MNQSEMVNGVNWCQDCMNCNFKVSFVNLCRAICVACGIRIGDGMELLYVVVPPNHQNLDVGRFTHIRFHLLRDST